MLMIHTQKKATAGASVAGENDELAGVAVEDVVENDVVVVCGENAAGDEIADGELVGDDVAADNAVVADDEAVVGDAEADVVAAAAFVVPFAAEQLMLLQQMLT